MVPNTLKSKLLDFVRPGRKVASAPPDDTISAEEPLVVQKPREPTPIAKPAQTTEVRAQRGAVDFPLIGDWLKGCERHMERGRDKHEYSLLAPMFKANGCTRIDDIPRMSTGLIRELAAAASLNVTIGLVNRVHQYAADDVEHFKQVSVF